MILLTLNKQKINDETEGISRRSYVNENDIQCIYNC